MTSADATRHAQGGGYGPPGGPGGYGPPGGPGGYGPPGGGGGGYGPPGGPGGYGPPGGPGGYGPPGYPPAGAPPGGYGPPGAPYGGGYQPPPGGPGFGPTGNPQNAELKKKAQTWLIISAVSFFVCSSCFGIIGGVLCFMAMQAADQGNLTDGENKLKWGKIITIVGFAISLLLGLVFTGIWIAQMIAAQS